VIILPEDTTPTPTKKSDDNLVAAVSYLWILSIVILLVKKDSDYVTFHARQGLVLFGASIVLGIISIPLFFLVFLIWLLQVVILVAVIIGFIQALSGKRYKMPVVGDIAEKINI